MPVVPALRKPFFFIMKLAPMNKELETARTRPTIWSLLSSDAVDTDAMLLSPASSMALCSAVALFWRQ